MDITRAGVGVAVAAVLLGACTGESPTAPTQTSASRVSSPSVSSTPTPSLTPEDEAAVAAEAVLRAYYRAFPVCMADPPNSSATCFDSVAIGTELINRRNALAAAQSMQTSADGTISVASVERYAVDLTSKLDETPPTVPTVTLRVCADVSAYNILDKDGKSIVPADRKPRSLVDVSVYNYKLPDTSQWRVGYVVPVKDGSC